MKDYLTRIKLAWRLLHGRPVTYKQEAPGANFWVATPLNGSGSVKVTMTGNATSLWRTS